jgi:hypothetical protein
MSRPRFKTRRTEDPGQDPHWQDVKSPTSWQHLRPVPYKRDPPTSLRLARQSHDKSPPRTRSLRLARQVSASHELSPLWLVRGLWHAARAWGASTTTKMRGGTIPRAMQMRQLAVMQATGPDKSLNAGMFDCTAIPSTSSPTLPHASSARGTQTPPTMSSSLDLGSSVAG